MFMVSPCLDPAGAGFNMRLRNEKLTRNLTSTSVAGCNVGCVRQWSLRPAVAGV